MEEVYQEERLCHGTEDRSACFGYVKVSVSVLKLKSQDIPFDSVRFAGSTLYKDVKCRSLSIPRCLIAWRWIAI